MSRSTSSDQTRGTRGRRRFVRAMVLGAMALAGPGAAEVGAQDPGAPAASADPSPHSEVALVSEVASIRPGRPFHVAVHVTLDPGWHTYWVNAGDAGFPLFVEWRLPGGFEAGAPVWPAPHFIPVAPLASYGYEGQLILPVEITPPASYAGGSTVELAGSVDFLVCEEICLPASAEVRLELPVLDAEPAPDPSWGAAVADTRARAPGPAPGWRARAWTTEQGYVLEVAPGSEPGLPGAERTTDGGAPDPAALAAPHFFVDTTAVVEHARPQRVVRRDGAIRILLERNAFAGEDAERLSGVLVADLGAGSPRGWEIEADVGPAPEDAAAASFEGDGVQLTGGLPSSGDAPAGEKGEAGGPGLLLALLLAFAGGLLLNLMPCVFPVLSVKILGFVEQGGADPSRARRHGLAFTAGVVASFWVLGGLLVALRAAGQGLGWGFQLQSPAIVALLALLLFGLGLNLSGVFEIGLGLTRLGGIGAGRRHVDSFLTGGLTVLVATPCTAPFMGAALGFALVQPAAVGLTVFTALALGLAAPYVILSSAPALLRRLPRPGPWMVTLRQALAFPLYATAAWLAWVFGRQAGIDATALLLFAMIALAAGGWLLGRAGRSRRPRVGRLAATAAFVGALLLALQGARFEGPPPVGEASGEEATEREWEVFSPERVAELRAEGRAVFVDFTASWCLSCKVNEKVALDTRTAREAFAAADVALVKADWTNRDSVIARALASFGRSGVPLYVLYPAGGGEPEILPAVLTPGIVAEAVRRAVAEPAG